MLLSRFSMPFRVFRVLSLAAVSLAAPLTAKAAALYYIGAETLENIPPKWVIGLDVLYDDQVTPWFVQGLAQRWQLSAQGLAAEWNSVVGEDRSAVTAMLASYWLQNSSREIHPPHLAVWQERLRDGDRSSGTDRGSCRGETVNGWRYLGEERYGTDPNFEIIPLPMLPITEGNEIVPEPSAAVLVLLAAGGFVMTRRREKLRFTAPSQRA